MILVSKQDGCVIKEKNASHLPHLTEMQGRSSQSQSALHHSTSLAGRQKKENKRNRIIELQRNEMFEQKIISLTCSL